MNELDLCFEVVSRLSLMSTIALPFTIEYLGNR